MEALDIATGHFSASATDQPRPVVSMVKTSGLTSA
jgi:hypothetical protein